MSTRSATAAPAEQEPPERTRTTSRPGPSALFLGTRLAFLARAPETFLCPRTDVLRQQQSGVEDAVRCVCVCDILFSFLGWYRASPLRGDVRNDSGRAYIRSTEHHSSVCSSLTAMRMLVPRGPLAQFHCSQPARKPTQEISSTVFCLQQYVPEGPNRSYPCLGTWVEGGEGGPALPADRKPCHAQRASTHYLLSRPT